MVTEAPAKPALLTLWLPSVSSLGGNPALNVNLNDGSLLPDSRTT